MQENIIIDDNTQNDKYQIIITGISWKENSTRSYVSKKDNEELPTQFTLDLPENVLAQANKKENNFKDIIETFVYNFLTRKFSHEVYSCSIWLPLEKTKEKNKYMSTRCKIWIMTEDNTADSIYCHHYWYFSHVGDLPKLI